MFPSSVLFQPLNNIYSLFGYSEKSDLNNNNVYDKILLIYSNEQCFFEVKPALINGDSLLNFDIVTFKVFKFNNEIYFTAKTGAIFSWEKKRFFCHIMKMK